MTEQNLSLRHVRRNCLDCCCDDRKYIIWCTCDGLHSTRCEFWPFRFGIQPATFRAKYGDRLLNPEKMPPATINLDDLPGALEGAALGEIGVEGYCQPAVEMPQPRSERKLSPTQREELTERLRRGREWKRSRQGASGGA